MPGTDAERIHEQARKIHESGALGKSDTFKNLLDYLVEMSVQDRSPKEVEIALDVFGKDESFDVSRDALVRVYMHKLRQKLDAHYSLPEHRGEPRLEIPRGKYQIVIRDAGEGEEDDAAAPSTLRDFVNWPTAMFAAGAALAVIGLAALWATPRTAPPGFVAAMPSEVADTFLWSGLIDDEHPVELVLGEYFLFSVLNQDFEVVSDIRDFGFNSHRDFTLYLNENPHLRNVLRPSATTYVSRSAAEALPALLPMLLGSGKEVYVDRVTSYLELREARRRPAHTIFLGPFATLAGLRETAFENSNFTLHPSTEVLIDRETGDIFLREGSLDRPFAERYVDYALLSRTVRPDGTEMLIIAAVGDAGVTRLVQSLLDAGELTHLQQTLRSRDADLGGDLEALYEISGMSTAVLNTYLHYAGNRVSREPNSQEPGLR